MIALGHLSADQLHRLARYERLRGRLPLPRLELERAGGETQVWIEPPPPVAPTSPGVAALVVGWLAELERAWGAGLAQDLWPGETGWDPVRSVVVVGRGLLQPSHDRAELQRWSTALGIEQGAGSYVELARLAAERHRGLRPLLQAPRPGHLPLRALRELGRARLADGAPDEALDALSAAHTLRRGDVAVASELVRAAIGARRTEAIPETALACLRAAADRADAGLALARWHQAHERGHEALRAALTAAGAEPTRPGAWAAVAQLAQGVGDEVVALHAVERLAELGSEGALEQLWHSRGPAACFALMDRWAAAPTARFLRLRLAQLHAQERTHELLQLVTDNLGELETDAHVESWIAEAARRAPDAALALRQALYPACMGPDPSEGSVRLFLRACLADGVFAPIVQLAQRHPGRVPPGLRVRALLEEGQHAEVLAQTASGWADDPQLAWARCAAMLSLALRSRRFDDDSWRAIAAVVARDPATAALARERLQQLATTTPELPGLSLLRQALGLQ